ncbi:MULTISPECIES: hypothetical protein [Pseudomonadota]|jgi:hypothetical protein|uniref:hypothetical protein n=1 Tax=Pseudomonadota TaxID=1224 RepID=UPI00076A8A7B|nr:MULTISPECIES: hypothetical protein [Pseudomonadota]
MTKLLSIHTLAETERPYPDRVTMPGDRHGLRLSANIEAREETLAAQRLAYDRRRVAQAVVDFADGHKAAMTELMAEMGMSRFYAASPPELQVKLDQVGRLHRKQQRKKREAAKLAKLNAENARAAELQRAEQAKRAAMAAEEAEGTKALIALIKYNSANLNGSNAA